MNKEETKSHNEKEIKKPKTNKKEESLKKEIENLKKQILDLQDASLREKAENINYRKRKDDKVTRLLKYKDEELITEMLPIIDMFENGIKMDDNNLDDEVSKFLTGFKMIYSNLITVLEKYDVNYNGPTLRFAPKTESKD